MSFLFGHKNKVKPSYTGLALQTSTSVVPVPLGWGFSRKAPNIIWQGDFKAIAHKQKSGKGFGGKTKSYTYSGSYIMSLGWGPITAIGTVWKDQAKHTTLSEIGFTLIQGNIPQAPWGFMTTNHAAQALGYPGIAQLVVANYDLGQSNTLPQHSFECQKPLYNTAPGGRGDADIARVVNDFLTNPNYGAILTGGLPLEMLMSTAAASTTGDNCFQTYCTAMGFGFSPDIESQEAALSILDRWTLIFNTALVWTGYSLQFLPYGTETVAANGVTYLPDTTPKFAFTDADFLRSQGDDPVVIKRLSPADSKNWYQLEVRDRANEYNPVPVGLPDQALADVFGLKHASVQQAHEICYPPMGSICAGLVQQRLAYTLNTFEFTLSPAHMLRMPGETGTITDQRFGTVNVRIIDMQEQSDGSFKALAEEYAGTLGLSGAGSNQTISNTPINTQVKPSAVNPPILFQPPPALTNNVPQLWAAVSGGDGTTADPNWGGADVYVSTDGGTSYNQVGTINTPTRMGVLSAALPAFAGANPDATDTLGVSVAMSGGAFSSATAASAAAAVTLGYIQKEGTNAEEFISYTTAALTAPSAYNLTGLYRGLYGSAPGAHASGAKYARLEDENVFKYSFPTSLIGSTIFVKFVSFNAFGGGYQDISTAVAYSLQISSAYTYTSPVPSNDATLAGGTPAAANAVPTQQAVAGYVASHAALRFYGGIPDKPLANEKLFDVEMVGGEVFDLGFPLNIGNCDVAPTGAVTFAVAKNGTTVGTMNIAAGATAATWTLAAGLSFVAGDRMAFFGPVTQDATLSGLRYTFNGRR